MDVCYRQKIKMKLDGPGWWHPSRVGANNVSLVARQRAAEEQAREPHSARSSWATHLYTPHICVHGATHLYTPQRHIVEEHHTFVYTTAPHTVEEHHTFVYTAPHTLLKTIVTTR